MKKISTICILFVTLTTGWSQITFTKEFMPNVGDTLYYRSLNQSTEDFSITGGNYIWDFSGILGTTWAADTFVSVTSTPILYNAVFNNVILYPAYKATLASPQADQTIPPSTSITNVYFYYKETDTAFAQVGFAANVGGAPLPVKFDNIDYIYKFPSTMGSVDSCYSSSHVDIPNVGSYLRKQNRYNEYDGWGTLYTVSDTFEVFRIKTTLIGHDTLIYNSMPIPINSNTIEYKWFSTGYRNPVFQVTVVQSQFSNTTNIKYIDNPQLHINISEIQSQNYAISPNPCINELSITSTNGDHIKSVKLYTISGAEIYTTPISIDNTYAHIDMRSQPSAAYIVEIVSNKGIERKIVMKK